MRSALWWGLYLVACGVPGGGWTIASPLVMTVLLLKVSGVALLERGLTSTKPGYADYIVRPKVECARGMRVGAGGE